MSVYKIGEYIHYDYDNYKKYGIAKAPNVEFCNFKECHSEMLRQINGQKNSISPIKKQELEDFMNYLHHPETIKDEEILAKVDLIRNKVLNNLIQRYSNNSNISFDLNTGNVQEIKQAQIGKVQNEIQNDTVRTFKSTIERRLKILKDLQNKLTDLNDISKVAALYNQYNNELKALEDLVDQKEKESIYLRTTGGAFRRGVSKDFDERLKELVLNINETIAEYTLSSSNSKKGTLEELLDLGAVLGIEHGIGTLGEALEQQLSNSINKLPNGMHTAHIQKEGYIIPSKFATFRFVSPDGSIYTLAKKDVKADITYKSKDGLIKISTKNYNFKAHDNMNFLSGASLLYYLQDAPPQLVNTYFNVYNDKATPYASLKKQVGYEIKCYLLYKAMVGDTAGRDEYSANLLAINDNTQGKVKLYYINNLLKQIIRKGANSDLIQVTLNDEIFDNFLFDNTYVFGAKGRSYKAAYSRISNMMAQAHAAKIRVSMSNSVVGKDFGY